MEQQGWVKFYREWMSNIAITKDNDHLAVWIYLLTNTTHTEKEDYFNAKKITLKAGQLLCMQKDICNNLKLEPTKLRRILKLFKSAELIDYQTDNHKTLITLVVWDFSQSSFAEQNADIMPNQCRSNQETENEKEKRSKREKDKEKEINKNEKNERIYIPPYIPPSGEMDGNATFSPLEKDLDRWLEEDDGIDEWDKMTIFYKNCHSDQWSVVSDQQLDYDIDTKNASGFALTNPIQQEKKEIYIPQPPIPLLPCEAKHTEGVHGITQEACMESTHRVVWNQPSGCPVNEVNPYTLSPDPYTLFDEFWQAYPKKVGKGYAQECFKKIKPSRKLLDTMLEAIAKQKKSDMWKRDKGQYIPNPSTWLNQKRWEDDLGGETEEKPRLRLGTYL